VKDLKVEDASVVFLEGLAVRDHPMEELLVQGEGRDGGQQPAVTWEGRPFSFTPPERRTQSILSGSIKHLKTKYLMHISPYSI